MIDEQKLAEWQRLCDDATDGPWCLVGTETLGGKMLALRAEKTKDDAHSGFGLCVSKSELPNYEFIVASREAVPALIAEVRELQKEADWLANKASINCPSPELEEKCTHKYLERHKCTKCWREAAREAVSDD